MAPKLLLRAWIDPEYKQRLLENGTDAIDELGYGGLAALEELALTKGLCFR